MRASARPLAASAPRMSANAEPGCAGPPRRCLRQRRRQRNNRSSYRRRGRCRSSRLPPADTIEGWNGNEQGTRSPAAADFGSALTSARLLQRSHHPRLRDYRQKREFCASILALLGYASSDRHVSSSSGRTWRPLRITLSRCAPIPGSCPHDRHIPLHRLPEKPRRRRSCASARLLSQEPERDAAGRIVRLRTARLSFTPREIARLFQPYVSQRFLDQFKTVAPLAAYLVLFQLLFLRQLVQDSWLLPAACWPSSSG